MKTQFIKSASGHELHLQVNYLSTALLSLLLLTPLRATVKITGRPSHLTVVTSELHISASFRQRSAPNIFEKFDDEISFSPELYNVSKLLGIVWVRELAANIRSSEVIINTVNPGLCWSTLHRDQENFGFTVFKHICAWTAAQGGHCLADAVTVKQAECHGGYLSEQKLKSSVPFLLLDHDRLGYILYLWSRNLLLVALLGSLLPLKARYTSAGCRSRLYSS